MNPGPAAAGPQRGKAVIMALVIVLAGIPLYALTRLPADRRPKPASSLSEGFELAVPSEAREHA